MLGRGAKLASVLGMLTIVVSLPGMAGAKSETPPEDQRTKITIPEAASEEAVGEPPPAGSPVEDAKPQPDLVTSHGRDLDQRIQDLSRDLEAQREAAATSQARLEQRVRAGYKGKDLAGITLVLSSLVEGDGTKTNAALNSPTVRMITKGRESIQFHRNSQRALKDTLRQLNRKKKEYRESQEEQHARTGELQTRDGQLEVSVGGPGSKKEQMEARLSELRDAEQAGLFERPPASGGEVQYAERELEIAREDIVARPVEPIPYARYVQIYKASAKRYRFAKDWYVLAAVGKVESNHGENMGPSSAGAMGPMQFLPSTWKEYGVDGNKDGVANIMDPEDAIPAAAAYLKAGGAPHDWYAALYTYNHAGWYVREVLGVAEGYRRLAKDDKVQPYV